MAEYLIQDTTLDAIADAINAKTGGSSAMTPAEMVTAIGSISGGSLPTGMTHIGSGSFTFSSLTIANTNINHNLSFTPKAVLIWTADSASASTVLGCFLERQLFVNEGSYKSIRLLSCKANTAAGEDLLVHGSTNADLFITSTTFNIGHGSKYYSAGATYNWFAFD